MDEETLELENILKEDRRYEAMDFEMNRQVLLNDETQKVVRQVSKDEGRRRARY